MSAVMAVCSMAVFSFLPFTFPFTTLVLASDFSDEVVIDDRQRTFAVTASQTVSAALRNVFVIERPNPEDMEPDDMKSDVLHYNQKFCLRAHPYYTSEPYYLSSTNVTPYLASRISHQQLVFVTDQKSYRCCWKLMHRDPRLRFETDGEPVRPDEGDESTREPFLLEHTHTGNPLASVRKVYMFVLSIF